MSRRPVPPIAREDLRDHADDARIARVWERIEHDLGGASHERAAGVLVRGRFGASRGGASSHAWVAFAAAIAAFGGGVLFGKVALRDRTPAPVDAVASRDAAEMELDVLAAGSDRRAYPIPGGGQLVLQPGATVEVERAGDGAVVLKLVQGAATIDTSSVTRSAGLVVVAGEAQLNTQAGSVFEVRRNPDDVDVVVSKGSVSEMTPAGARPLVSGERRFVPIHNTIIAAPLAANAPRVAAAARRRKRDVASAQAGATAAPEWLKRVNEGRYPDALVLIKKQSGDLAGAIRSAHSAEELMGISDLALKSGDTPSAITALKRVVESFSGDASYASTAAFQLGKLHEKAGNADLAREYFRQSRSLEPKGAIAEDALCRQIRAAEQVGNNEEAAVRAKEYVASYPDGHCRDEAERVLHGDDDTSPADPAKPGRNAGGGGH